MNSSEKSYTLYIPVAPTVNENVDTKDILHLLGDAYVSRLTWGVSFLDWLGEGSLPERTDNAPNHRVLVSGFCLLELAEKVYQTIEGTFVGYTSEAKAQEFLVDYEWFEASEAVVELRAMDNTAFEVSLRFREDAERIAEAFEGVEWETPLTTP